MTIERRNALVALVPDDAPTPMVDVGADHGLVAQALGCWATERMPDRRSSAPLPWIIADGLRPFRRVGTAIIAGMGAHRILDLLDHAPPLEVLVVHAPDRPPMLRQGLNQRGWRIEAERLAPEAGQYAVTMRARPGVPHPDDLWLHHGPVLLRQPTDPNGWIVAHLRQQLAWFEHLSITLAATAPERSVWAMTHRDFLQERLAERL
ncbi:MAG: tRNA (adenine(22)-N(1))-methyltransferase TrmK [Myxococcota bacterium]